MKAVSMCAYAIELLQNTVLSLWLMHTHSHTQYLIGMGAIFLHCIKIQVDMCNVYAQYSH